MKRHTATIRDVALQAGVAPMTVSRVIHGHRSVAPQTCARVVAAMQALQYTPNGVARGLRTSRTQALALLIGNITNPFFTLLARGFEEAVRRQGFVTMVCNTDESPDQEREYLDLLLQQRVDGYALSPVEADAYRYQHLTDRQLPLVLVDREVPGIAADRVVSDGRAGAAAATRHLIEAHGHRRVAALFGPKHMSTAQERRAGYEAALREAGLPVDPTWIGHGPYTVAGGRTLALAILSQQPRPTALLAASNFLTAGALEALAQLGLSAPEDVALIGAGPTPHSPLERRDLSVVAVPAYAMGHRAGELLLERLQRGLSGRPRREEFPTELILSRSCGCPEELTRT